MFKLNSKLTMACSAAVLALAMAACSSSSDDDPPVASIDEMTPLPVVEPTPPTPVAVDLAAVTVGYVIAAGVVEVASGGTVNHGDVSFTCSGDEACTVTVADDGTVTSIGGTVAAANSPEYAAKLQLAQNEMDAADALAAVQTDAETAASTASTAATDARTASDDAQEARADRAIIQTGDLHGGNSGELADSADMQAKAAADAATAAQEASDAAAAATDVTAATRALVTAEAERDKAVAAQGLAETQRDAAMAASEVEVKIVEKTKTVGPVDDHTSITVDGVEKSSTVDKVERKTGLLKSLALSTTGVRDANGKLIAPVDIDGVALDPAPGRTPEKPSIGFTYDSDDDTARLTLVTAYLGEEKQMQFVRVGQDPANPFVLVTDEVGGPVLTDPTNPTTAGGAVVDNDAYTVDDDGKITIDHDSDNAAADDAEAGETGPVTVAPKLAGDDFVDSADTDSKNNVSLYYVDTGVKVDETAGNDFDNSGKVDADERDNGIDETKIFLEKNINDNVITYTPVAVIQVTIDNATPFTHIHYGLWNGLSGDKGNKIADLGTGFVNALSDMGMTNPDHSAAGGMPNFGTATYNGNWVANIQAADPQGDGPITRHDGESSVVANFVKDTVKVGLDGLATLDGAISENTFMGTGKPKLASTTPVDLGDDDDFMGSFKGAFFGPSAAEAGGVFDYSSDGNKKGAFRGSFGGAQ